MFLLLLFIITKVPIYVPNHIQESSNDQENLLISSLLENARKFNLILLTILDIYKCNPEKREVINLMRKMKAKTRKIEQSVSTTPRYYKKLKKIIFLLESSIKWPQIIGIKKSFKYYDIPKFHDNKFYECLRIYFNLNKLLQRFYEKKISKSKYRLDLMPYSITLSGALFNYMNRKKESCITETRHIEINTGLFNNIVEFILQAKFRINTESQRQYFQKRINNDGKYLYESIINRELITNHAHQNKEFKKAIVECQEDDLNTRHVLKENIGLFIINIFLLKEPITRHMDMDVQLDAFMMRSLGEIKACGDFYADLVINNDSTNRTCLKCQFDLHNNAQKLNPSKELQEDIKKILENKHDECNQECCNIVDLLANLLESKIDNFTSISSIDLKIDTKVTDRITKKIDAYICRNCFSKSNPLIDKEQLDVYITELKAILFHKMNACILDYRIDLGNKSLRTFIYILKKMIGEIIALKENYESSININSIKTEFVENIENCAHKLYNNLVETAKEKNKLIDFTDDELNQIFLIFWYNFKLNFESLSKFRNK